MSMNSLSIFILCVTQLFIGCCSDLLPPQKLGLDGLDLCQSNCGSSDRLTGPTRSKLTRDHPWDVTQYPYSNPGFCKLGCQIFFAELPNVTICEKNCGYYYRYHSTAGYSDIVEEAKLECQDGCSIGIQVCQAGYYCAHGLMTECPPGKYRQAVTDVSIVALETAYQCTNCPFGRYRTLSKGKSADECSLCPIGKYANSTGLIYNSDCKRCAAGKVAEQPGMRLCIAITDRHPVADSIDQQFTLVYGDKSQHFFKAEPGQPDGIDYYRETVPFIGRW